MCGIRPAKIVRELMEEGYSDSEVVEILKKIYEVSDEKIDLAYKVAKNEKILLDEIGEKFSKYIYRHTVLSDKMFVLFICFNRYTRKRKIY